MAGMIATARQEDFVAAVKKAYPNQDWEKAYADFLAAGQTRP